MNSIEKMYILGRRISTLCACDGETNSKFCVNTCLCAV